MADNSYAVNIKIVSKNGYHTPAEARAYYKKYSRDGITWHWWNTPDKVADTLTGHNNIVNYITNKAKAGTGSVNYVASRFAIDLLVNPDNVAWASQSGNPTTVSVECSPHLSDEAYKRYGWLADQLEQRYGKTLKFYKHSDWYSTSCPGNLDLNRIRQEANKWKSGEYDKKPTPAPTPKPTPAPTPPPSKPEVQFVSFGDLREYVANRDTYLYDMNTTTWAGVKNVKAYKKGEKIQVAGTVLNKSLNSTHLVTQYSLEKKTPNGFSQTDWDRVVPPPVVPVPPEPEPEVPSTIEPSIPDRLNALEKTVAMIVKFLDSIFKSWRS